MEAIVKRSMFAITAAILLTAMAACASADQKTPAAPGAAKPARACFYSGDIRGWKEAAGNRVNVLVNGKDIYQMQLIGSCPDINTALGIGLQSGADDRICEGQNVTLIVPAVGIPRRCPVTTIVKLTPEQVATLPAKEKP